MGSRGAFVDITSKSFNFKENGQEYFSLGTLSGHPNVKVLVMKGTKSVSAPYYSHTPGRIYATVQNGSLKYISYYDNKHKQTATIDFGHKHNGVSPHVHFNMDHNPNAPGISPTKEQLQLVNKIKKEFNLK